MLRLFHISEEGNIDEFIPRESKKQWGNEKYVWAISEEKIHNYLIPRECPRICISMDKLGFLSAWINLEKAENKKSVIFISNNWKKRIGVDQFSRTLFKLKSYKIYFSYLS